MINDIHFHTIHNFPGRAHSKTQDAVIFLYGGHHRSYTLLCDVKAPLIWPPLCLRFGHDAFMTKASSKCDESKPSVNKISNLESVVMNCLFDYYVKVLYGNKKTLLASKYSRIPLNYGQQYGGCALDQRPSSTKQEHHFYTAR